MAASAQLRASQKDLLYGGCMSASPTREGPEPFQEDSGWEQAVARTVCLLRARSLLRSEDYLENGGAKYRLCEIRGWQQYTPKSVTEGDD